MIAAERAVLLELLRRELGERFRGSVLGAGWLVLMPLLQLAVLAWVFGHLLPARAQIGALPYAAFLALGLWPWNLCASAMNRGVTALTDNAALIGKVAVPHRLYVDARVLACVLLESAGLLLVVAVLLAWGMPLRIAGLPWLLASIAVLALYAWGMATLLAVLQVFLRDIAASISQVLMFGFFLTPVLYDRRQLDGDVATLLGLNPLAAPIETLRDALAGAPVAAGSLLLSAGLAVVLCVLARRFLRRARAHLEDFL